MPLFTFSDPHERNFIGLLLTAYNRDFARVFHESEQTATYYPITRTLLTQARVRSALGCFSPTLTARSQGVAADAKRGTDYRTADGLHYGMALSLLRLTKLFLTGQHEIQAQFEEVAP